MKTLEQVIDETYSKLHDKVSTGELRHSKDKEGRAFLAAAIRQYNRECNAGLGAVVYDALLSSDDRTEMVEAVIAALPPQENIERQSNPDPLIVGGNRTALIDGVLGGNKLSKTEENTVTSAAMLVADVGEEEQLELGEPNKIDQNNIFIKAKAYDDAQKQFKLASAIVELENADKDDWVTVCKKASAYNELRKKFPFLPGELCYTIIENKVYELLVLNVDDSYEFLVATHKLATTAENVRVSNCFKTIMEAKASIPVVSFG